MKIRQFLIQREYEIACKLFLPETAQVRHVILGVHGFAGDKESSMLELLAHECGQHGAALICFDFPAHGASPVDEAMLTIENCKKDLLTVAAYVTQQYPHADKSLFATSFGGYISLLCYENLPDFRFVLRAPAITMPQLLLENVLKLDAETFRRQGAVVCGFERLIRLPYAFYEELLCQEDLRAKAYTAPMLIHHGDRDDVVPPAVIAEFAQNHSLVQLLWMPGADHRFKNPGEMEAIVAATRHFLGL